MALKSIADFKRLEGGILIETLEKLIAQLLQLLKVNSTPWQEGIDLLNDLIYLKVHDGSSFSKEICTSIFDWIRSNYDGKIFKNFDGSYEGDDVASEKLVLLLDQVIDTIYKVRDQVKVEPFLNAILEKSTNEFETYNFEELMRFIKGGPSISKAKLSEEELDKILLRADNYFESEFRKGNEKELLCGLRETIKEHKLCYLISWCMRSEKYTSRLKKALVIGTGPLMISKKSEKFQFMGSSPMIDWIYLFELEIQNLEEYFYLEIPYEKKNISKLKAGLKCSTPELLKMLDENKKITFSEPKAWNSHLPDFSDIARDLNQSGIACQVEIKTRERK